MKIQLIIPLISNKNKKSMVGIVRWKHLAMAMACHHG
jgi:hypothetical protein